MKKYNAEIYSTAILQDSNCTVCTLTVKKGKKNKNKLLAIIHSILKLKWARRKEKPQTVTFYNATKCGVHVVDHITCKYTIKVWYWRVQYLGNSKHKYMYDQQTCDKQHVMHPWLMRARITWLEIFCEM